MTFVHSSELHIGPMIADNVIHFVDVAVNTSSRKCFNMMIDLPLAAAYPSMLSTFEGGEESQPEVYVTSVTRSKKSKTK